MSIVNETENLVENLRDTRTAILERGGTISPTAGFNDVPAAIATIPSNDSYYDIFWDTYQQNGNRTDYDNAFSGRGWTNETFEPKYDIVVYDAYMLFRKTGVVDLGEALKSCGKKITISTSNLQYAFNNTLLEVIDGIEFTEPIKKFDAAFSYSNYLREIKVPLPITETTVMGGFDRNYALEEVRFDGTIGQNGLNLQWSTKLSKASIENIFRCLSTTTSGLSITLSKTAVNNAFISPKWNALIATRSNWTINLL